MVDKVKRLRLLEERVATCTSCRLCETRTRTVFARGNPDADLCFVGEGPGRAEDLAGDPFIGSAGRLLDKMIVAMGISPADVYICNVMKCRPPENRKPQPDEIATCRIFLEEQLEFVRPKTIVSLGATAAQGLLIEDGISSIRGKWQQYQGIPVMPTYHPAYLLRQPLAKRDAWDDLQKVMARRVG